MWVSFQMEKWEHVWGVLEPKNSVIFVSLSYGADRECVKPVLIAKKFDEPGESQSRYENENVYEELRL